jgi:hypothetical protein
LLLFKLFEIQLTFFGPILPFFKKQNQYKGKWENRVSEPTRKGMEEMKDISI